MKKISILIFLIVGIFSLLDFKPNNSFKSYNNIYLDFEDTKLPDYVKG